ncbi:MAG: aldehyde dehydrogenase family protein [Candidatus Dormibacteria bacterium]
MRCLASRSPQNPAHVVAEFPDSNASEVAGVMAEVRLAQRRWGAVPALERSEALSTCADMVAHASEELTNLGVAEVGKPRSEMAAEIARGVRILRYYAACAVDPDGDTYPSKDGQSFEWSRDRPWGVAGLITPWNFPVAIPLWKAAPALAYGNAVICKPAPAGTGVALRVAELLNRTLPPHLFTMVTGGPETGRAVVSMADAVSFTGSVAVGHQIVVAAAGRGVPVQAEMGGQNPSIVLPDADPETAAKIIASAAMAYAGQKCTATSRVVVVGDPRRFVEAFLSEVQRLPVGDPDDPTVMVGPVISATARDTVVAAAAEVLSAGGDVLLGGQSLKCAGYYVRPTVVRGIQASHRVAQQETFGPFVVIQEAADVADSVRIANGVAHGLAAAVFTGDLDLALKVTSELEAGMVRVNGPTTGADFYVPFGGMKESSYGLREQGKAARRFYTQTQTVSVARARA